MERLVPPISRLNAVAIRLSYRRYSITKGYLCPPHIPEEIQLLTSQSFYRYVSPNQNEFSDKPMCCQCLLDNVKWLHFT